MSPKLYIGQTPGTPDARRKLRHRALDLHARLSRGNGDIPTCLLLHFHSVAGSERSMVDLLLARPSSLLVGVMYECAGPIEVLPNGHWVERDNGRKLHGPTGETPLEHITSSRHLVCQRIESHTPKIAGLSVGEQGLRRTIGALICVPATHPDTRVPLDIDDHRRQIKLLGLDELSALVAMVRTDVELDETAMQVIMEDVFAGRLWHDGQRMVFELAYAPLQIRLLDQPRQPPLRLLEEQNLIGRREEPLQYEYRLTLAGDDLMSNDHAIITYYADGRVMLRDTSTNGTWVLVPGESEERLHHTEREIVSGSELRMGATRMRLEKA